jgi:hypothetical protein
MTNTPASPAAAVHDSAIAYADTVVPGASINVASWESWSYTDGGITHYYAKGPCPGCSAEAQGHYADIEKPVEGQGADRDAPDVLEGPLDDTIEIPVQCHCGFAHGTQNATSCGRSWSVIITRAAS